MRAFPTATTIFTPRRWRTGLLSILALAASAAAPAALPDAPPPAESWYVIRIAGQPVGYEHEVQRRDGEVVEVSSEYSVVLNRMGSRVEIASAVLSRETADGGLLSVDFEIDFSEQVTRLAAEVGDGKVRIFDPEGEAPERIVEVEDSLLGPEGVRRLSLAELRQPGDEISYPLFSPELGAPTTGRRRLLAVEELMVEGRAVTALKVQERLAVSPLPRALWLDGDGRLLRTEQTSPFGLTVTERTDAATARRAASGGELPEESYGASLVHTQIRIPRARQVEQLELELRHRSPELGWPDLAEAGQEVLSETPEALVLALERRHPAAGQTFPVAATPDLAPYLEPNRYIQSAAPEIVAQARRIVAGHDDLFAAARALERWVAENMRFDMGVVLAPATEVFANRRGTCTEYAVLLTTLARAVGIPARYVMGYVYVDGIFGGHAWTEVLVGEEWIALDGAVVADGPADAARFAFVWGSLAEGPGSLSMGAASQLFGQLDVMVRAYRLSGGERVEVPTAARGYQVDGDLYRNRWLGVSWRKPPQLTFTDLDATWPDDTLVALAGEAGEVAQLAVRRLPPWEDDEAAAVRMLEQWVGEEEAQPLPGVQLAGRPVPARAAGERAALAVPDGEEMWLLRVEGEGAADLLLTLAAGLELTSPLGSAPPP